LNICNKIEANFQWKAKRKKNEGNPKYFNATRRGVKLREKSLKNDE
jgi:hypothetical protein